MEEENQNQVNPEQSHDNTIALMHYSQLLNYVTGFFGVVAVIVIWQLKEKEIPEIRKHAIEILNFQISLYIYLLVSAALSWILIGIPFLIAFLILGIYAPIRGGTAANKGEWYKYPLTLRLLK